MKKLLTLALASCFSLAASAQMPRAGLVAYYPFSGNANDVTVSAHHLMVTGATLTTDRFGNANSAYAFNGSSDNMNADANGLPDSNSARTLSAWFNAASFPGSLYSFAVLGYGDRNQPCNSLYGLLLWNVTSSTPLQVGTWKACFGNAPDTRIAQPYLLNTWYHLAATYDGAGNEAIYLNGVLVGSNSIAPMNTNTSEGVLRVGSAMATVANSWFNGQIDDIAIYNRALSACEIYSLYDTTAVPNVTTQPVAVATQIGSNAMFTVQASGANTTYQWQQNSGAGFVNLSNAGPYSGTTTDTLVVNNATAVMSNYLFRCIVHSSSMVSCNDTSNAVALTTVPASVISTNKTAFSIRPNPFSTEIIATASQNNFGGKTTLELSDITGRVVGQQMANAAQSEIRMQTSTLPAGVYFVRMIQNEVPVMVQKFVKQ